MPEPITMATVAVAAEAGTAAAEGAAATGAATGGAEVAGGLAAGSEAVGAGAVGKGTEAFVGTLRADAPAVAETMLSRAQVSGAELSTAMGRGTGLELGRATIGRGAETATHGTQTFDPAKWSEWKPMSGERVGPQAVAERFRPLCDGGNLESYAKNLGQRDGSFGQELERRTQQMREARTPADRDAAHQQLRRSTSGKLGEAIAADGLGALGKVELQRTVTLPNATTIVDGRLTATTNPLVLGRGVFIEKGGSLSWEAKARAAENLGTELRTHVAGLQVPGHLALGDKSIVLVSRDIYQVSGEAAARQAVKESGSYVMALLPEKRVMDEALMRVIRARLERA